MGQVNPYLLLSIRNKGSGHSAIVIALTSVPEIVGSNLAAAQEKGLETFADIM